MAEAEDSRFVFEVHNDPTMRAQAISKEPIPWADHVRWYQQRLLDEGYEILIATSETQSVGVARIDFSADTELHVAVATEHRGQGLGTALIRAATERALERAAQVVAHVVPSNSASLRAFEKAGFVVSGPCERKGVELLRLVHSNEACG